MSVNVSMTVNGKVRSAEVEERTLLVQLQIGRAHV